MEIKGKTAIVTGAASGIGLQYAHDLLKNDAKKVAILDLPTSNGQNSAAELEKEFGKGSAVFYICDVTNAQQLEDTFKEVINDFKQLDILVNNAGIMNDIRYETMVNLNLLGLIRSTLLALDHMGKHKGGAGGTIVNISSVAGLVGFPEMPIYVATKHAVIGFSQALKYYRPG
ncbi:15-hydroxyprostaglandin dehydrogenase [NAD(+)] isoform X2 [Cephus cinctus]|uniref:15-hydroxyprostaglandin dehydrogenase [NAD(+)] isoform X2 n=1 Tax=Cephus cinctus TaxID=211228 RepID=A0AAJ7VXR1_CEPCN|nr:15-hydroxyprostaglandin dehydrogenase [NAD(+)] isoform X2 [Cephus cinctus]